MGKYFGTDGFRGEANVVLTADHAYRIGRFLGAYYGDKSKCSIVIGKDTRRSSYMFEYAIAAGITASGADAYLLHVIPTPGVAYVTRTEDFACGVMISASHNPYNDNGIKIINENGEKMEESVIERIEDYLDGKTPEVPYATGADIGRTVDYFAGRNRYMGYLMSLSLASFKGRKVGLDCSNGAASSIAKNVFDALGADTFVINDKPNGTNINSDCGSTHIEGLQAFVKENGLDVGFAYDGDADRCLCVDENGRLVDGDMIMYVCGKYLKENGQLKHNTVVTTVMSNLGLYKAFDREGINYEKTDVGDKYVYECMRREHYRLGGEQSGHIIFSKHATTGDGVLTSIKVMEVLMASKEKMSKLCEGITIYPQLLRNVRVEDKDAVLHDPDVLAAARAVEERLGGNGRILFRKSGTEPLVRVMVEAESEQLCRECADSVVDVINKKR